MLDQLFFGLTVECFSRIGAIHNWRSTVIWFKKHLNVGYEAHGPQAATGGKEERKEWCFAESSDGNNISCAPLNRPTFSRIPWESVAVFTSVVNTYKRQTRLLKNNWSLNQISKGEVCAKIYWYKHLLFKCIFLSKRLREKRFSIQREPQGGIHTNY